LAGCCECGDEPSGSGATELVSLLVGTGTSAERSEKSVVQIWFSSAAAFMPLIFIFPRKRVQQIFLLGALPGSWAEMHEFCLIQMELCVLA
jgi:hypothetical protein